MTTSLTNHHRAALCHEWLTTYGGSEQVAASIADALSISDVYTFACKEALASTLFPATRVHEAYRYPGRWIARQHWQWLLPLMPWIWQNVDLQAYDVVITSAHAFVNYVNPNPDAVMVSYCHTPLRVAWERKSEAERIPRLLRPVWPVAAEALKQADRNAADRVDVFVANSHHVASRIERYYNRAAEVIYPPVDTTFWCPGGVGERKDFFLLAGRLVAYKNPVLVAKAARLAKVDLVVAGDGPMLRAVRKHAAPQTTFVVAPTKEELRRLFRRARALVAAGVEDFGMTFVEAQACGAPVIALDAGGAKEAVQDGISGRLFPSATPENLADQLRSFDPTLFSGEAARAHALKFDSREFQRRLQDLFRVVLETASCGGRSAVRAAFDSRNR